MLDWLRQHGHGQSLLFSWCAGAEVLAASGLIDGETVTTHWADIEGFERSYPAITWKRGVRYVDTGRILSTGGITSGVDETLHLLASRNGQAVADKVAQAMAYPAAPFGERPELPQYSPEPVDSAVYLNLAFNWPKPRAAVWLFDGVGEVDLAAAIEAYGLTSTNQTTTVAEAPTVLSQHGLQIVPRSQAGAAPSMDRVVVPGGIGAADAARRLPKAMLRDGAQVTVLQDDQRPTYAFTLALEDLASTHDVLIATYAARQLEVRSPLRLMGPAWPLHLLDMPVFAGIGGGVALFALVWLGRKARGSLRGRRGGPISFGEPSRSTH